MGSRRWDMLSLVPLVAIVALIALVAVLIRIGAQTDDQRARTKLATDALWVEQTLRFQMSVDEDMLVRLALDGAADTPQDVLTSRARLHIAANPEMLAVRWFDAQGRLVAGVPEGVSPGEQAMADLMLRSPAVSSRPVYGPVTDGVVTMA
ncbi:hypothetical protein [Fuscovulum blasticum]|nr:hypothetical protein [Fuscovulum blasticum]